MYVLLTYLFLCDVHGLAMLQNNGLDVAALFMACSNTCTDLNPDLNPNITFILTLTPGFPMAESHCNVRSYSAT